MGYKTAGLDISVHMLKFAEKRAQKEGVTLNLYHQDMRKFQLTEKYDAAICVLDSLRLLKTTKEILSHFDSVASNLTEKGIFITEWSHPRDWLGKKTVEDSWVEEGVNSDTNTTITVRAQVKSELTDFENQLTTDTLEYTIKNGDYQAVITETEIKRLILPQEFLLLVGMSRFEVVSFYGAYDVTVGLDHPSAWRTIAVLQKVE
jgi:ubiquinone/menaquinone biosynthesis C-methylase UbiE